ncbi:extracellular solute-binding protein [Paenibacillus silviterrae]|uniref:extracellular solute-binding protein n=1 Tax=Paenibacillus silviterrae TaxID=3242194 RepID=UPI0025437AC7|nr:extracellular solute-binding protein [Paenibacillus chinjuensis]
MSGKPDRITFQGRMDDMLTTLRTEIVNGLRPKGSYLPSEIVLGEQFQVSKKSVRKALDILVNEGLITKIPRVGNRVSPPDTPPVTTLRFGIYPSVMEQDFLPELLERFYEKHPHIRVETVTLPYTKYSHSIRAYLEQGFLDAFTLNNRNFMDMHEADALPLLEPQSPLADQHPFLADLFTEQGILYSVPLMFSPIVLCYNKDLFKQCGLREPNSGWTWDRLLENAAEINRQTGIIGFFSHIESLNRFPIFLLQSGFRFAKDASGYRFTDPELWDILHSCRSLFHQQGFLPAFLSEGDGDAERLFKQQKTSMIMTSYYGLQLLKNLSFQYDITPLPYSLTPKTLLLATGIAINRFSKQKEATRLLVRFLASEPSQRLLHRRTLSLPANIAAADDSSVDGPDLPSRYHLYREIVPTFADYRDLNISMEALDGFGQELKLFWAGLEEPKSILEHMQSAVK